MKVDLNKMIPEAWDYLWAQHLKSRAKHGDFRGQSYYLTAADIERRVRDVCQDIFWATQPPITPADLAPLKAGERPRKFKKMILQTGVAGGLQRLVRDWLLNQVRIGKFASHNFDRGHISGMRFRPVGAPISEAESKTIEAKRERRANPKPKPRHMSSNPDSYGGLALCIKAQRDKKAAEAKAKGQYYHHYSSGRSHAWTEKDPAKVTCPRCLKLMKGGV